MPAVGPVLGALIQGKVHDSMKASANYDGPLSGKVVAFYIEKCNAIGNGIAIKSLGRIKAITKDKGIAGAPLVIGAGLGKGIFIDAGWFSENLYNKIREVFQNHPPPWPGSGNGVFLKAWTDGVADSIALHYKTAWQIVSTHANVYLGTAEVRKGKMNGLIVPEIASEIIKQGPNLKGPDWPKFALAVAEIYVKAIHFHSTTGKIKIIGVCIPGTNQVCGVPVDGAAGVGDLL